MRNNNNKGSRAAWARGFVALFAALAIGLGGMASPAEAAPFAYVTNSDSQTVSVIDTATNTVVATIPVGVTPIGVAVTPDGKHAYVVISAPVGTVSVIDTASNTVSATIPVGIFPEEVAVAPDGKHAYVTNSNEGSNSTVSVIDTVSNTVAATVPVGSAFGGVVVTPDGKHAYVAGSRGFTDSNDVRVIDTVSNTVVGTPILVGLFPFGVAVTPDGKHVYVTNSGSNNVSVIATTTNTVVATLPVGIGPAGVAVTPDGKHAYVTNSNSNTVSVIDTVSNTVVATIPVGTDPFGVAVTPDGKHVYVTNLAINSGTVSVIETASNTVVATVAVGAFPSGIGIVPPPPGVPFLAFNAKLEIDLDRKPNEDRFELESHFTLSSTAPGIHPAVEPVTLQIGTFTITIPPGSFKKHEGENGEDEHEDGSFTFHGVIDGVSLEALIKRTGTLRYAFHAEARDASLTGTTNPVPVMLTIGGDSSTTSVKADIDH